MDDQNQPPKPPGYPEPPNQGPRLRPNERDVRDLKVAQNIGIDGEVADDRETLAAQVVADIPSGVKALTGAGSATVKVDGHINHL